MSVATSGDSSSPHRRWGVRSRCLMISAWMLITATSLAFGGRAQAVTLKQSTSSVQYYVAMGDSLATETGSYPNLIYQHELAQNPNLQLVNFAVAGATTDSVLNGSQLTNAEAFLRSHVGQVAFLTIDIGGNDVDNCVSSTEVNTPCVQAGFNSIASNLPPILTGLRSAYSGLPIYGMDLYDPFLAYWLDGPTGQSVADQTESDAVLLKAVFGQIYTAAAAPMADPASLFQTTDFSLTGTWNGATVPQNVSLACQWTYMCTNGDFHTNSTGSAQLAAAFEQLIDDGSGPLPGTTTQAFAPTSAIVGQPASFSATVTGFTRPSGTVIFSVGNADLCTANLSPSATDLSGSSGSCSSTSTPPGAVSLTAHYAGNASFSASSATLSMMVVNATSSVTCLSVTGSTSSMITFKSCSPFSKSFQLASTPALSFLDGGGTLTWKKSRQTTRISLNDAIAGQGSCPKSGSLEHDLKGVVIGGTSTYVRAFDPVSLHICVVNHGGKISLVGGTAASL